MCQRQVWGEVGVILWEGGVTLWGGVLRRQREAEVGGATETACLLCLVSEVEMTVEREKEREGGRESVSRYVKLSGTHCCDVFFFFFVCSLL